jgi:hypothetical protein
MVCFWGLWECQALGIYFSVGVKAGFDFSLVQAKYRDPSLRSG